MHGQVLPHRVEGQILSIFVQICVSFRMLDVTEYNFKYEIYKSI